MQLTKFSKLKIIHTPGKNSSVADMLSRSYTKTELQVSQLKQKQLPPQIDFAILQNNSVTPVHYLIQHEEKLPRQKHDSHPILADYGTDQISIRINDKGNDIIVKPLDSFLFKFLTPFQNKYETLAENITNPYINKFYSLMILMTLVMMMTIYTFVSQSLLHFLLLIKTMIQIEHPLFHVLTVLLPSQNKNHLHYQLLLLIQLNLLNFLHTRFKYYLSMTLPSLNTKTIFKVSFHQMIFQLTYIHYNFNKHKTLFQKQYITGYVTTLNLHL